MRPRQAFGLLALWAGGCASQAELSRKAEWHMQAANQAADSGDWKRATREQRKAENLYDRASTRAYEEERPPPAPPATPPPTPLFDPQLSPPPVEPAPMR